LDFPNISRSLFCIWLLAQEISGGVVDAMEATAETTQHFSAGRFRRLGDLVYANRRTEQRSHFADPSRFSVRQIADVYWQQDSFAIG
jgi:hypothetical protein